MNFSPARYLRPLAFLLCLCGATAAHAATIDAVYPQARAFFPAADRFGALEGEPPAAAAWRGPQLLGYVFQTFDVVRIPAYSGRPINTLVGLDTEGRIVGVRIVYHEEPILAVGISEKELRAFTEQYVGKSAHDSIIVGAPRAGHVAVDTISGATITVMVENATLNRAARAVAGSRGLKPAAAVLPSMREAHPARSPLPRAGEGVGVRAGSPHPLPSPEGRGEVNENLHSGQEEPIWVGVWREKTFQIVILGTALLLLTAILVFQDWLAKHPKLLLYVRDGYLVFTLFFIGWYALAQLSVVNVLTFVHSVMHGFQWDSFLVDPMMFILWSFVAVTILLWGRGVYCGWLCSYGALQELTQQVARRFNVRQYEFPEVVHERLWAVKYIILIVLFGVSLQSLTESHELAEVEPFKTAITMHFLREWPFVLYAAGLVLVSAFNRKFFCKYLCPLGAALAIVGRFRIFDWLRRRKECGKPCQICHNECEVRCIRPTGEINMNECHYCLDCQVTYWNDRKCPPLAEQRKRRERAPRARELVRGMEAHLGPSGLNDPSPDSPDSPGCAGCERRCD